MLMNRDKPADVAVMNPVAPREFLSTLVWIKADGMNTAGTMSLVEILAPAGWETPWHVHLTHDEYFYILDGSVTAQVGDTKVVLKAGDFAFGPRGVPHGYRVDENGPARLLMFTNDRDFAEFVRDASDPTSEAVLPPPSQPDLPRVTAAAMRSGVEVFGPLPF